MATTLSFSNEALSTTLMAYLDQYKNSHQYDPQRLCADVVANKNSEKGGERLISSFDYRSHSVTTQLTNNGYDPILMQFQPILTPWHTNWAYSVRPVGISIVDELENTGSRKILSKLESRTKETIAAYEKEFQDQLLTAGVASLSDINHLNGTDYTDGILEEDAIGSQSNEVCNVTKNAFERANPGLQNQRGNAAGSFSSNGLDQMQAIDLDIETKIRDRKGGAPTNIKIYMSRACHLNLKKTLQSSERYADGSANAGTMPQVYGSLGAPIVPMGTGLPSSGGVTTSTPWSAMWLDHGAIGWYEHPGHTFGQLPFRDISGHMVKAMFFTLFGQFAPRYYGTSGLLVDAEAW
jgi:hypothetical protein